MNNYRSFTLNTNQNIIVEFTDERIIPDSGLAVVDALFGKIIFPKTKPYGCNQKLFPASDQKRLHHPTYIGMLRMGKPYFEAVHEMDDDKAFY